MNSTLQTMSPRDGSVRASPQDAPEAVATIELLDRARAGDSAALERLFERYLPPLKRWAHGRLPRWARDLRDTDDLVQESVLQTLRQLDRFEPRRDGALHAYLRTVLLNRLRDEVRRVSRAPRGVLASDHPDDAPSPVEEVIGRQALDRYERALAALSEDDRAAVIARVELGGSYADVAETLGKPTADAARMAVGRALLKLAQGMGHGQ